MPATSAASEMHPGSNHRWADATFCRTCNKRLHQLNGAVPQNRADETFFQDRHLPFIRTFRQRIQGVGSLKELGHKLVQILPPDNPRVTAFAFLVDHIEVVLLEHLHGRPRGLHQEIILAGGEPEQLQPCMKITFSSNATLVERDSAGSNSSTSTSSQALGALEHKGLLGRIGRGRPVPRSSSMVRWFMRWWNAVQRNAV